MKTIIIQCRSCGTKNRIRPHSAKERPICGRCSAFLQFNTETQNFKNKQKSTDSIAKCIFCILLIIIVIVGMIITHIMLKNDYSSLVVAEKIRTNELFKEYIDTQNTRITELEAELSAINSEILRKSAEDYYLEELSSRQSFDSQFALSKREKSQLQMKMLASDSTHSFHESITSVASEAAPPHSDISVHESPHGLELHVYFDMSTMTSGEHGTQTKHTTIESLKDEVITLISKVINDIFLFCRDLNLSTIHVACRHYVLTENIDGSKQDINTVLYKVHIKNDQLSEISSNPFLDIYSSSMYFQIDIDNFDTIEIIISP